MHPGNIVAAAGRMQEAMEQLQIAWGSARDHWNDGMSQHFEEQHIRPIFERINVALPALTQMAQALQQAQTQCGEPGERSGL
jgi:hypothetical protein